MNRFCESPFPQAPFDRDEDGFPTPPLVELTQCEYCNTKAVELTTAAWDVTLQVCPACAACEPEPECECRMAGDQQDSRGCELHDSTSPWNVRMRAVDRLAMLNEAGCTPEEVGAWMRVGPGRVGQEVKREVA